MTYMLSIFLMAFTTSLERQVASTISVLATSLFGEHSLISTVYVVQGVVYGMPSILEASRKYLFVLQLPSNLQWRK